MNKQILLQNGYSYEEGNKYFIAFCDLFGENVEIVSATLLEILDHSKCKILTDLGNVHTVNVWDLQAKARNCIFAYVR